MIAQSSLFAETPEERTVALDAQIADLAFGRPGGILGLPLDDTDRAVLKCIRFRRGAANAISLRKITEATKLDARSIKQAVRTLRLNYRLPIGSSKSGTDGGYFLMVTDDDRKIWRSDVIDQVRAQLAVLHAADGRQAALEALGQLRVEIEQEAEQRCNECGHMHSEHGDGMEPPCLWETCECKGFTPRAQKGGQE